MRMRKLGRGQTVVFCVPDEIQVQIRKTVRGHAQSRICVSDVLLWVISETYIDIRQSMSLWASQNDRFIRQEEVWRDPDIVKNGLRKATATKFLEPEARDLAFRYEPRQGQNSPLERLAQDLHVKSLAGKQKQASVIERCKTFGLSDLSSHKFVEEQERELSPEIDVDAERVVQRAPQAEPRRHSLDPAVVDLVKYGRLTKGAKAYQPLYEVLRDTSACENFDVNQMRNTQLLATEDFAKAVLKTEIRSSLDSFQRSVQWILTICNGGNAVKVLVVVSPYEARLLLDKVLQSEIAALHLYKPRTNVSFRAMDQLDFYTICSPMRSMRSPQTLAMHIPRALAIQLSIFAGQLYFSCFEDYVTACETLGLAAGPTPQGWKVATDGFIERDADGQPGGPKSLIRRSPINFLKLLMSKIRRSGQDISKTHMGLVLDGKVLQKSDFE